MAKPDPDPDGIFRTNLNGMKSTFEVENWRVVEILREMIHVHRRRHDQNLKKSVSCLHASQQAYAESAQKLRGSKTAQSTRKSEAMRDSTVRGEHCLLATDH